MPARSQKSTIVRSVKVTGSRAAFAALQRVAPPLAERVAERLFTTPPRHRKASREWREHAWPVPFALETGRATLRGVHLGRGPAVLLVHGWGGRGRQLAAFARPLLEAGCSVVAFDGPAHGASTGRTTNLVELSDAVAHVAARFRARGAIAHSLGGAAVTLALHRGLALDAVVLVAPPRAPAAFFDGFSAALGLGPEAQEAVRLRIERRVGVRMADLALPRLAAALRIPALVLHDRADVEVPFADGAEIAAAWPGARLVETDGLGHRRILREPGVVAEASAFVAGRLERCGCGRLASTVRDGTPRCETCLLSLHLEDREGRRIGAAA